ncbi:hypothetical protein NM688_g2310 [Phlebia brevispora]|uniref:Uncharacterized protein n=1 Tax=Phlebia brevispora TaxID=194682 RepID=A0ACC1T923_9APHY|nr:hypothetical protein NM688_g2310 [Phlebia brevispora]
MSSPESHVPQLTSKPRFLSIVGAALLCHYVFRRWEPIKVVPVALLLVCLPGSLSPLLAGQYGTLGALVWTFLTFFTTLGTSILVYRLSPLHPLARYPGPTICKVSAIWMARITTTGKRHIYLQRLHDQYGDVVRIAPNEISIRDIDVVQPLFGPGGLPKGPGLTGRNLHEPVMPLIAIWDPTTHAQRRKPWIRAFSTAALKEYQPIVIKRTAQLLRRLHDQHGTTDLAQWISFFAFDFMSDMAFGGGTEMMREGDKDGLWALVKNGMSIAVTYEHLPWLSYYTKNFPTLIRSLSRLRREAHERTMQRYNRGSRAKDLFYYLSNEDQVEKESPSRPVVVSDGILAMIAGSDTTAVTIANIFYLLLIHGDKYNLLREEVDRYYPRGEDPLDPKDYINMHYLGAVINETMRLFPAIPCGGQRAPPRGTGGKMVGKYYVPEGTQVRAQLYSIQRDERNFSDPQTFWPERWLIADGLLPEPAGFVHNANALLAFSSGPANCVGKNLAMFEMRMVVTGIVHKFHLKFHEGWDRRLWLEDLKDVFVSRMGRLPVVVSPQLPLGVLGL